jgi:hypothetical protein
MSKTDNLPRRSLFSMPAVQKVPALLLPPVANKRTKAGVANKPNRYADEEKRREYMRVYMAKRRAK